MNESLVHAQTPVEFFKEQVEAACERQHLRPQPLTSYYVVSLLSEFVHLDRPGAGDAMAADEPLGVKLLRALQTGGNLQRLGLKQVGDASLFISGFFSDSLRRSLVDIDYYVSLGGYAYRSLVTTDDTLSPIFAELSDKFVGFVDVLSDVSARTSLTNDADLLRLYEKWVRTGSKRNGDLLAERGIVPNATASLRVQ
ncbi:MAG TPA: hypothetical protein VMO26_09375 [Vicinamibacterales bacterium]|nr:hypothetical protein [Vicinamibacterales bacterium]